MKPSKLCLIGASVSVVISLGCSQSPTWPSKDWRVSALSLSPHLGPSAGATAVTISGIGFQSGAAVTVDGTRVDATVLNANAISLEMPAHAAGKVDVAVIRAPGQAPYVAGEYEYVGPPAISELFPNIGSIGGGTDLIITGTRLTSAKTVTLDGTVINFKSDWPDDTFIYFSTPAHAAGPVEVIVTDEYGQSGRAVFTYASPDTFDLNGDWNGWAYGQPGQSALPVVLTIRDNVVIGVSCGNDPSLTLDPAPVVANGEFSFADGGVGVTGKFLSPIQASGSITAAACGSRQWNAEKKLTDLAAKAGARSIRGGRK